MKHKFLMTCALFLMVGTVLAAAPNRQVIYVGNENVTSGGYWTTDSAGTVTAFTGEGTPADKFIHYDAENNVLTLHNATIKKGLDYSESIEGGTYIFGSAIGVFNERGNAELTIKLEGTNTIAEVSNGIYVLTTSSSASNATLTIEGDGSLDASASQAGIWVQGNSCDAALKIENAKVTATLVDSYGGNGVIVQSAENSSASLTVDGGSLTATGSGATFAGIQMQFGSGTSGAGTPTVTVSGNAIVRANGSAGGITSNSSTPIQFGAGSGIIFNGKEGTVYGDVTLQEDLTINQGETLTISDEASLDMNGKTITVQSGGCLVGELTGSGTVKYAPTITTDSLPDGTVGTEYCQTFTAEGDASITWSITSGSLPDGLNLNETTGEIFGTPTMSGCYDFTLTASNDSGSDNREFSLKINEGGDGINDIVADSTLYVFSTKGMLHIMGTEAEAEVYDVRGVLVYCGTERTLHLPAGVYIVHAEGRNWKAVVE